MNQMSMAPAAARFNVDALPMLDDKQAGHIRHIANLSRQLPNDWAHMVSSQPFQEDFSAFRYQLAYMYLALALAHVNRLPAAPGLFRDTMDRLIKKMLHPEVWAYWRDTSSGGNPMHPDAPDDLVERSFNPVGQSNIMYSGYIQMMSLMHTYLFNDRKYAQPGALTFKLKPMYWGGSGHVYEYDQETLSELIYWQMAENGFLGVSCEPGLIFQICNQIPILGFRMHDLVHGGTRAKDVTASYIQAWKDYGILSPNGHYNMMVKTWKNDVFPGEMAQPGTPGIPFADAWCGTLMSAWNGDFVKAHYGRQIEDFVVPGIDGALTLADSPASLAFERMALADPDAPVSAWCEFGWLAAWTSEIGDEARRQGLLEHADRYMNPTWLNGGFFYPRRDDKRDAEGNHVFVDPNTGNALLAYARLNVPDGLAKLYAGPWGAAHFSEPAIGEVSANVDVLRACLPDSSTLVFTLAPPHGQVQVDASLVLDHVTDHGGWTLSRDGVTVASGDGRVLQAEGPIGLVADAEGRLRLTCSVSGPSTFVMGFHRPFSKV